MTILYQSGKSDSFRFEEDVRVGAVGCEVVLHTQDIEEEAVAEIHTEKIGVQYLSTWRRRQTDGTFHAMMFIIRLHMFPQSREFELVRNTEVDEIFALYLRDNF